jgi:hypothetical protein
MRRVIFSLLMGCTCLLVSMCLIYITRGGNDLTWKTGYLFWPGSLIAIVSECGFPSLSSPMHMKSAIDECRSDILVLLFSFLDSRTSSSVLAKAKQKPEGK